MLILGIETSGARGSVALCRDEELLHQCCLPEGVGHARHIITAVDEAVRTAGVAREEIGAVAVSEGPGAFTGLRVGVTCAKMLAYVLGLRAVGVSSLEVAVQNVDPARWECQVACPLRDARRRFVYGQVFRWEDGRWKDLTGVITGTPAQVAAHIPRPALVFGTGLEAYRDLFLQAGQADGALHPGPPSLGEGQAVHVAQLGLRLIRAGRAVDPMRLVAQYYRRTEAEEKMLDKTWAGSALATHEDQRPRTEDNVRNED
jgi:tRNA threonylcarbamoyladenosine biosynthesis protein TsaB